MFLSLPWIVLLAFALAMDAFAVSLANGIAFRAASWKIALGCGLAFGLFQMLMPLIGYVAGVSFLDFISAVDHWIAFVLLAVIGGRMVYGAFKGEELSAGKTVKTFTVRLLTVQAVATSIDALAVGVGLGVIQVNLPLTIGLIGAITFCCSFVGVYLGKLCGDRFSSKAEFLGGIVLIGIGARILLEHTLGL